MSSEESSDEVEFVDAEEGPASASGQPARQVADATTDTTGFSAGRKRKRRATGGDSSSAASSDSPRPAAPRRAKRRDVGAGKGPEHQLERIAEAVETDPRGLQTPKRHVVLLGTTNVGKSTLANAIVGNRLRALSAEINGDRQALTDLNEFGETEGITTTDPSSGPSIGHTKESETSVVAPFICDSTNLVVWDGPGFADTRGDATVNICSSINTSRLISLTSAQDGSKNGSKGLVLCVLLAANNIKVQDQELRGNLRKIKEFIGVETDADVNINVLRSVMFCITKVMTAERSEDQYKKCLGIVLEDVFQLAREDAQRLINTPGQIVIFDPLDNLASPPPDSPSMFGRLSGAVSSFFSQSQDADDSNTEEQPATIIIPAESIAQHLIDLPKLTDVEPLIPLDDPGKKCLNDIQNYACDTVAMAVRVQDFDTVAKLLRECKPLEILLDGQVYEAVRDACLKGLDNEHKKLINEVDEAKEAALKLAYHAASENQQLCVDLLGLPFKDIQGGRLGDIGSTAAQTWSEVTQGVGKHANLQQICAENVRQYNKTWVQWQRRSEMQTRSSFLKFALREFQKLDVPKLTKLGDKLQSHSGLARTISSEQLETVGDFRKLELVLNAYHVIGDGPNFKTQWDLLEGDYDGDQTVFADVYTMRDSVLLATAEKIQRDQWTKKKDSCKTSLLDALKTRPILSHDKIMDQLVALLDDLKALDDQVKEEHAKNKMLDFESDYQDYVDYLEVALEDDQQKSVKENIERSDFREIVRLQHALSKFNDRLAGHSLKLNVKKLKKLVFNAANDLVTATQEEVERKDIHARDYLDLNNLKMFNLFYVTLELEFPELKKIRIQLGKSASKALASSIKQVKTLVDQDAFAIEAVTLLLVKSWGVAIELSVLDQFKTKITVLLSELKPEQIHKVGESLQENTTAVGMRDHAETIQTIIDQFPEFKQFAIEQFKGKAGDIKFEDALLELEPKVADASTLAQSLALLRHCFKLFREKYSESVREIKRRKFSRHKIADQIDQIAANFDAERNIQNTPGVKICPEVLGPLLGLICAQWTYAGLHDQGSKGGIEEKYLLMPHDTQILGILKLLCVDKAAFDNNLIQINTGEGKSVALGFTAAVLAKLGFHVDVVCYNQYLSERDFRAFEKLFEVLRVHKDVEYSDFEGLISKTLKRQDSTLPNVRECFNTYLTQSRPASHPSSRKRPRPSSKEEARTNKKGSFAGLGAAKERVLLLDEVDVFFSDKFYGRLYRITEFVEQTQSLVQAVWNERKSYENKSLRSTIEALLASTEVKHLQKTFPGFTDELLQLELQKMVATVKYFPTTDENIAACAAQELNDALRVCTLAVEYRDVVWNAETKRLGYVDSATGVPSFDATYSYITAFTYLFVQAMQKYDVSDDDLAEHLRLQPVCGGILYSLIPKLYKYTLGMSGTLDCLDGPQRKLLEEFKLNSFTYLPSTFKKNKIDDLGIEIHHGSDEEYHSLLLDKIVAQFTADRAVLVVFADQEALDSFDKEVKARKVEHASWKDPWQLSDRLDDAHRSTAVLRAVRQNTVTLMTRSYGRGTDFVCRDSGLVVNGGVHVIMTFFPQDSSEEKQIRGRTCRQDDPGSCEMVLSEKALVPIGATLSEMKAKHGDDQATHARPYLLEKRWESEKDRYTRMHEQETKSEEVFDKTKDACKQVQAANWEAAGALFADPEISGIRITETGPSSATTIDLCFVMDCTGSMQRYIDACGKQVIHIAETIRAKCQGNATIRMAFVGYRDFRGPDAKTASGLAYDNPGIEVQAFTEDITAFSTFVKAIRAAGGGDAPEDVCGGLEKAAELDWSARDRHLFLIADAPCHGTRYHRMGDNFPDGDPNSRAPEQQICDMVLSMEDDNITSLKLVFLKLHESYTDKMLQVINAHCRIQLGGTVDRMPVVDLSTCTGDNVATQFEKSVVSSVEISQAHFR
jgi:GTPase SAR1 family protein/DNA-binding winged helix-turn-helix (wHTH) protein